MVEHRGRRLGALSRHLQAERRSNVIAPVSADDGTETLITPTPEWITFSVTVDGDDVSITWDGIEVVSTSISGASPIGMDHVGLWTYDNDGGVYYDDLEITLY